MGAFTPHQRMMVPLFSTCGLWLTCDCRPRTTDHQPLARRRGHLHEQWLIDAFASWTSDGVSGAAG